MPANKNAMSRYKILDELLSSRYHNYSLDDLTEEVSSRLSEMYPDTNGVVRRTIEKDIYYLEYEGPFMVDIERYTISRYNKEKQKSYVKQCLRYSNPSYSIFKKRLTDDEEYLLSEALSLLGQFDGLPNLDALEGLRLGFGIKRNDRKIISFTKNPLENSNILGELFTSISQRQVIELHYIKFCDQNNELVLNVYPYLLKEYNRRWFLFAATENNGKLLCFGLDRIKSIIPLPSHKYIEYHEDVNNIFKDIIGVTINLDSPIYNIIIWVSNFSKDYIETKPIHDSQNRIDHEQENKLRKQYPVLREGQFYQINCRCNYELIRELASYGKDLLVIEPTEIQEKVRDRIQSLNEAYLQLDTI
jgi:predicted DNA-binding transcriptional regulator YafY